MKLWRGINLGGFLSQCVPNARHYGKFIGEADVEKIASWGFDHVRLPVDVEVFETELGLSREEGYEYVDRMIEWTKKNGLNVIIDLHRAYGYDFNDVGINSLFADSFLQSRFVSLWKSLAQRYGGFDNVAFELLNEIVEEDLIQDWNNLAKKTIAEIRAITMDTPIIVGGVQWNSSKYVKYLEKPEYDNVIYTFHFFEPLLFTHQKAYWVKNMDLRKKVPYPAPMEYYKKESFPLGVQGLNTVNSGATEMGVMYIEDIIKEAIEHAKNFGVELYCGELGVINKAPLPDTLRWYKDVDSVLRKYDIGYSIWTYKAKDFGITDRRYASILEDLLNIWINDPE